MISQAGWWTRTPFTNALQPIKWNATFWITFNFWWLVGLVNGLKPHPPFLCSQRCEMLIFVLCSTSNDQPGLSMDLNRIHHLSPARKMKCSYFNYVQLLMIGQAGQWTQTTSTTPLQPKKWNPHFLLRSTSDVGQTGQWTWSPSTTPLQPKKMKCLFLDYVHFWWSAWLIDEFEPHLPPLSSQKNEMLNFQLCSTSDDQPGWSMDSNPLCQPSSQKNEMLLFGLRSTSDDRLGGSMDSNPILHLSPAKEMKCSFLDYVQLLMLARLVNGLKPHPPPLSSQ